MAFRQIDNIGSALPATYDRVERKLPTVEDKGWTRIGGFTLRPKTDFAPQPGLQEDVCRCESNIIYMCGAATMGKSFTEILSVLYGIDKVGRSSAMISTRLQDSKKGGSIFRDNELVLGKFAGCEYNTSDYPTFYWPQWMSVHRLIHSNFNTDNPAERSQFIEYAKKNQNGLQIFDEANDLPEFQYHYWNSRNRDDSGMIPQSIYSFNPPGPENYFTRNLLNGGYIGEDWYFKPEMNGRTRYFFAPSDNVDEFIWGDSPEEVCKAAHITVSKKDIEAGLTPEKIVKSFTAFTGEAADNRMLVASTGGQSVANLLYSGQSDVLKGGYFGPIDNESVNVNRQMIHDLWDNPWNGDNNMYATLDVSGGNMDSDNCPMCIFKGNQLVAIETFRGSPKQLVDWIDRMLSKYNVPVSNFAFDATGIGNYLRAYTSGVPLTANRRPLQELDAQGNQVSLDSYFNLRSQLLSRLEVMLQKGELAFAIPKDLTVPYGRKGERRRVIDILFDEMNVLIFDQRNGKRYARSKDEYKAKFKSSPDLMDTIMLFMYFFLDAKPKKQPKPQVADDAYDALYARRQRNIYRRPYYRQFKK